MYPINPKFESRQANMTFSYEEMRVMANTLYDLHLMSMLDKIPDYPIADVENVQERVFFRFVNCMKSLEVE